MMQTNVQPLFDTALAGMGRSASAAGLDAIHHPDCAAVVWERPSAPAFLPWLDGIDPERLPALRLVLAPKAVLNELRQAFDASGIKDSPDRAALLADIDGLSRGFAQLMKAPYLRLRLSPVTTNACRKFHRDTLTARLVCTYRGTGTQIGTAPAGQEPPFIETLNTADPIVMRGKLWPETPVSDLLHRSPPIEGSGETRFVLVLDPMDEAADIP